MESEKPKNISNSTTLIIGGKPLNKSDTSESNEKTTVKDNLEKVTHSFNKKRFTVVRQHAFSSDKKAFSIVGNEAFYKINKTFKDNDFHGKSEVSTSLKGGSIAYSSFKASQKISPIVTSMSTKALKEATDVTVTAGKTAVTVYDTAKTIKNFSIPMNSSVASSVLRQCH